MRTSIVLLCLLLAGYSYAQDKIPAFGKIDKADLKATTCSYDPNAGAEWLIDVAEVMYNLNTSSVYIQTDHRCRIKILTEKGMDEADVKITYRSKNNYEDITNIDGYVYNLNDAGEVVTTKLESRQVFTKKVNENLSQVSFALPGVKAGSVVEYRYRDYKRSIEDIDDWYFQKEEPVRYSAYNLAIPEYFDFNYKVTRRQDMEVKKSDQIDKGTWFIMRNIPGLREEPFAAGIKDYIQRVDFQLSAIRPPGRDAISYSTTWAKLSEELLEQEPFGGQLGKNISGTEILKTKLKAASSEKEKISLIYQFVQKNMDWNGRHSFYSIDGIKQAWDKKSGNTGDINLLLVNLLKDAGLKASPVLVSTKDNGKVNTYYPFLYQFNEVMAAVICKDSSIYVMDACDKYNCYNRVPYDVQQTYGLVIDRRGPQFLTLSDRSALTQNISVQVRLGDDGKLEGEAMINSADYGRNVQLSKHRRGKLKETFVITDGISISPDSIQVENDDTDSLPLAQHVWFSGELQPSGGYAFVPYHLFTGLGKNPFTAEKRQTDIDFDYPKNYSITGSIILPDNYAFDDLPKNMRMIMADTSITLTRILQKDGNILSYRMTLKFERPIYAADEYPDVKEFFKKLYAALDEKIVVKKK